MRILSVGETNFGFLNIGWNMNPVVAMCRTKGDVLLLGHPLCEESLRPQASLAVIVTERDRSLRWVVKRLDMQRGVGGVGSSRHGGRW